MGHRDRLQQGGLAASVFPHKEGDGMVQLQPLQPLKRFYSSQITAAPDFLPIK